MIPGSYKEEKIAIRPKSYRFFMLNPTEPTIVGILTYISMINTASESFISAFLFLSAVEISCSVELSIKVL